MRRIVLGSLVSGRGSRVRGLVYLFWNMPKDDHMLTEELIIEIKKSMYNIDFYSFT